MVSSPDLPETGSRCVDLLANADWRATALGRPAVWPAALATLVELMIQSDHPMLVAWGPDLVAIYNDGHAALIGDRHPAGFGRPLFEVGDDFSDRMQAGVRSAVEGKGSRSEGLSVPIVRQGRKISASFDMSYTPIAVGSAVGGVLCLSTETTATVLSRQRDAVLLALGGKLRRLQDAREIVAVSLHALGKALNAQRVGFGEVQADGETILLEASYLDGVDPLQGLFRLDEFGVKVIAAQRRDRRPRRRGADRRSKPANLAID